MGFKYILEIHAELQKQDAGYWSKTPLNEFLSKCQDPRLMRVAVREGDVSEWKQIPAQVKIKQVIVDV
jgi:hypothetical protein